MKLLSVRRSRNSHEVYWYCFDRNIHRIAGLTDEEARGLGGAVGEDVVRKERKMSRDKDKERVCRLLNSLGFHFEQIPESPDGQRADLRGRDLDGDEKYLIEVKGRYDDTALEKRRIVDLKQSGLHEREVKRSRNERVSEMLREGARQLRATPGSLEALRLLWIVARGRDPDLQFQQVHRTLYGITDIRHRESNLLMPCYYFQRAEFARRTYLDGAIIEVPEGEHLCVNTLSANVDRLKRSRLCQQFNKAITDPDHLESEGKAFLVDIGADRSTEMSLLQHVRKKYDIPGAETRELTTHIAEAAVHLPRVRRGRKR